MRALKLTFILCFLILSAGSTLAQEEDFESRNKNRLGALMGYCIVPEQLDNYGKNTLRVIPTFGLDYSRWISPKFALGSFNDIELSTYVIDAEGDDGEYLVREFAFITTICLIYSPFEYFTVYAGGGYEFEKHHNFAVIRLGAEYEIPIRNDWDVSLGLAFDHKEVYNSLAFAISFGKSF